jgi:hypothetical protein
MKRDVVDEIDIASPCTVPWSSMRGDDRIRFCGHCRQNVYNVEALDRTEARQLVAEREGRLCVRILRRSDGTVVTANCWTRLRSARRRGIVPFLAVLLVVGWAELVAMRFGLDGWRRVRVPDRSFVPRPRRIMGAFRVIRPEAELDWLPSKQEPAPRIAGMLSGLGRKVIRGERPPDPNKQDRARQPTPTPHLSPPLVNPVLAGLPDRFIFEPADAVESPV